MKILTLLLLLMSCASTAHRDPSSQFASNVLYEYLDAITDGSSSHEDKAFYFMQLLRETDGKNSGEKIVAINGPIEPIGFTRDQLIDRFSSQKKIIELTKSLKIKPELVAWASGAKSPRVFKNEKLTIFFKDLFLKIEKSFADIGLNRINLFHAHIVYDNRVWGSDLIIVFHAFEYPLDLEPKKNLVAMGEDISLSSFFTRSPGFKSRNLIWSLRANKIWRIDTSKSSIFNHLVRSPAFDLYPEEVLRANTAQEIYFGKVVADINYFPKEYKKPFITRGAGNPPVDNF